jgi:hypothetical protein
MQDLPVKYAVWIQRGAPCFIQAALHLFPIFQSFPGLSTVRVSCEGLPVCWQLHIML